MAARPAGKEPGRIATRAPVLTQERERAVGKRHVAILAAFSMDVQDFAVAIDIGHLKARAFQETKTTGINRGERATSNTVHSRPSVC